MSSNKRIYSNFEKKNAYEPEKGFIGEIFFERENALIWIFAKMEKSWFNEFKIYANSRKMSCSC